MKAMVRVNSLSLSGYGSKTLTAMENHGKRLDATSGKKRIRELDPIVYKTLDLTDAYKAHSKDCKTNKSLKSPVLHAILKFPSEFPTDEKYQKGFLKLAVEFINKTYGGDAVFAARVDRDELGEHVVDVFFHHAISKSQRIEKKIWLRRNGFRQQSMEKNFAKSIGMLSWPEMIKGCSQIHRVRLALPYKKNSMNSLHPKTSY